MSLLGNIRASQPSSWLSETPETFVAWPGESQCRLACLGRCRVLKYTLNMRTLRQLLGNMSEPLTENQIQEALASLPGWAFADEAISKTYRFGSFPEAIGCISEMAFAGEKATHHPELSNVYSNVTIRRCPHDAGNKVTLKDVDLAGEIEKLAKKRDCQATI